MADISHNPPRDLDKFIARAEKFINSKETMKAFVEQAQTKKPLERRRESRHIERVVQSHRVDDRFKAYPASAP
jgi:hypothetical protein